MSGLWTPSGDFEPESGGASDPGGAPGEPTEEQMRGELARFQAQLAATPAVEVIANHAVGLFELARLHLALAAEGPESIEERMIRLNEARLCCDAFAGMIDALGERLGEGQQPLAEGLSQLRIAIVEIQGVLDQAAN